MSTVTAPASPLLVVGVERKSNVPAVTRFDKVDESKEPSGM
jgi:hypothetical protein